MFVVVDRRLELCLGHDNVAQLSTLLGSAHLFGFNNDESPGIVILLDYIASVPGVS